MTASEWAAWVQAVGSVVAIFAAIGIAAWQQRASRLSGVEMEKRQEAARSEAERSRARSMALSLLPPLQRYVVTLRMLEEATVAQPFRISYGDLERNIQPGEEIKDIIARSHELGSASRSLQEMLRYASLVQATAAALANAGPIYRAHREGEDIDGTLSAEVRQTHEEAKSVIAEIHMMFLADRI